MPSRGAHGVFTTDELRGAGHTVATVRSRSRRDSWSGSSGLVLRARNGSADRASDAAGGRPTCVSALALQGVWVWPDPDEALHVGFPSHASGRRAATRGLPEHAIPHGHPEDAHTGSAFPVMPLEATVDDLLRCLPPHLAVASLDSLLHERLVSRNRLEAMISAGPHRTRFLRAHLEPRSESGLESIVRFRLAMAGIDAQVQVRTRTAHRVDLEVDDWLVLEIDGRAVHVQAKAFTMDRIRSAQLTRTSRVVLHFASATVLHDSEFLLATVADVRERFGPIR